MILNDTSIRARGLVRNANDDRYRTASYDLTVAAVIAPSGEIVSEHLLPPQGMIKVVSEEIVDIPANITGYVHVKTGLCNEGVLALNIGIVDPCFCGPLQSALINFGKVSQRIRKGMVFGRITFHEQMAPDTPPKAVKRSVDDVKAAAQSDVDRFLAADFLNFSKTVEEASKKAGEDYRATLLKYIPLMVVILASLTYFLNFANMSRLESYISVKDRATEERQRDEMADQIKALEADRESLKAEIELLRNQVSSAPKSTAAKH